MRIFLTSIDDIKASFRLLLRMMPQNGCIVANGDDSNVLDVLQESWTSIITFGNGRKNQVQLKNIQTHQKGTSFIILEKDKETLCDIPLFGEHNVFNACATFLMARQVNIPVETIQQAFDSFLPPKRRLQLLGTHQGIHVFDDFAHHPTAVAQTLKALKSRFPGAKIAVAFEPRSATSATNIHQQELESALLIADAIAIAPPYRQKANMLDVEQIVQNLHLQQRNALVTGETEEMLQFLKQAGNVVVFMSNGKFDNAPQLFIKLLETGVLKESTHQKVVYD